VTESPEYPSIARHGDVLVMRSDPRRARDWFLDFVRAGVPLSLPFIALAVLKLGREAVLIVLGETVVLFPLALLGLQLRVRFRLATPGNWYR
jgi:hypothetical protein